MGIDEEKKNQPHLSLETKEHYFSFYPNDEKKSSRSINICGSRIIKNKHEDLIDKPDEIIDLNLNTEAIDRACEILSESGLQWQRWSSEYENGFNSATVTLLLLKVGGFEQYLSRREVPKSGISDALFQLETPINISAFSHFAKTCNRDISPEITINLARHAMRKNCCCSDIWKACISFFCPTTNLNRRDSYDEKFYQNRGHSNS